MIPNERKTRTRPISAKESDLRAASTCLASPPEFTSLIADRMIKTTATMPAKVTAAMMILLKIIGRQDNVGISGVPPVVAGSRQLVQSFIIWY